MEPSGNGGSAEAAGLARRRRRVEGRTLLAVGLAGSLGALARDGLTAAWPAASGHFPWAVLVVNGVGAFAIGVVLVGIGRLRGRLPLARPIAVAGFLGGFTTFSTYAVGADLLVRDGALGTAALYAAGSLALGVAACAAGTAVARRTFGTAGAGGLS